MWHNLTNQHPQILAEIGDFSVICSSVIFNYVTMTDSGVINSGHEPNSVQSLLQCLFERRTLAEKLKVKELGPDQPDGLIYWEDLFVKSFAVPQPHLKNISPAATAHDADWFISVKNAFLTATLMLFISSVFYHSRLTCTLWSTWNLRCHTWERKAFCCCWGKTGLAFQFKCDYCINVALKKKPFS